MKTARLSLARAAVLSLSWQSIVRFSIGTFNESDSKNAVQTQDPSKAEEEETSLEQLRYDAANQIITPPCCVWLMERKSFAAFYSGTFSNERKKNYQL
jgi:hypothetical protein